MPSSTRKPPVLFGLTLLCFACFAFASISEAQQFRTFTTLPQEAATSICFRTFVPAETTQAQTQTTLINFQTFQPVKVEQSVAKPARKPKAKLTTATFYCPPCEAWKKRIKDLPFEVEVVKSRTSPITNRRGEYLFPVFSYHKDGKQRHYQGSVDGFLKRLNQTLAHR